MTSSGPRYFGFVIGGSSSRARRGCDHLGLGAERVQRGASPAGIAFEDVAGTWLKEILGLPRGVRRVRHGLRGRTRSVWPRAAGTC